MKSVLKKILFIGTSVIISSSVYAEAVTPSLKISGYTSINGMVASQQKKDNGKGGGDPHLAIGASDLRFTISGKSANDFGYKYIINIESISNRTSSSSPQVNRNYIEFNNDKIGTIQFGTLKGPDDALPKNAVSLAGGAGGIDGAFPGIYNYSEGVIGGVNPIAYTKIATKIVWYTPQVMGFQAAFGYTPNTSHIGKAGRSNATGGDATPIGNDPAIYPSKLSNQPFGLKNFVYGLTYKNSVDLWSFQVSGFGISEHSRIKIGNDQKAYSLQRSKAYQLSVAVGYDKWDVAAGYIDNGKSRLPTYETLQALKTNDAAGYGGWYRADLGNAGKVWNIGTSYTLGAYQFTTGYHRTDRKTDAVNKASSDTVVTTLDFTALQGLKFFGEVDLIRTRTNDTVVNAVQAYNDANNRGVKAVGNNSGAVFVLGSKISF